MKRNKIVFATIILALGLLSTGCMSWIASLPRAAEDTPSPGTPKPTLGPVPTPTTTPEPTPEPTPEETEPQYRESFGISYVKLLNFQRLVMDSVIYPEESEVLEDKDYSGFYTASKGNVRFTFFADRSGDMYLFSSESYELSDHLKRTIVAARARCQNAHNQSQYKSMYKN